jgi:hypothetical protein
MISPFAMQLFVVSKRIVFETSKDLNSEVATPWD